jgi:Leucine-rich repeat (LRR) protein
VPSELGQLSALRRLDLRNNQLSSVPSELGQLSARGRVFLG